MSSQLGLLYRSGMGLSYEFMDNQVLGKPNLCWNTKGGDESCGMISSHDVY